MIKCKSAKTQPEAKGNDRSNAAEPHPSSNGHARCAATSSRTRAASAEKSEPSTERFQGLLQEFNFSSKGGVEGFLLHSDGQTVQINVTPDVGFAVVRGIGQHVEATVEHEPGPQKRGKGEHPVYNLITLTGADGKILIHSCGSAAEMATVQGVVKRINYAPHGEANGVILDSGDFIYMKPEGMKRVELKVGDQVTAEGTSAMMPLGQQVIEAKTVNGTALAARKPGRPAGQKSRS